MHEAWPLRNGWIRKLERGLCATVVLALVALFSVATTTQIRATSGKKSGTVVRIGKGGYLAGDTVSISGEGFSPFESVMLRVAHDNGAIEAGMGHDGWWVYAGTNGNFQSKWFLNPGDTAGIHFVVTADGATSASAKAAFVRTAAMAANRIGDTIRITAEGFNPSERVQVQLSNGRSPVDVVADDSGRITTDFALSPAETSAGSFTATAVSSESLVTVTARSN